ncbi:MAG TPA: gamma-butyrobetaine hydroxylase-like domain-containing protein, partial [Ktedonobacterales bacterium]
TDLYELKPVGRYGLSPVWGDSHHTGIYTYEKLRAECQCDVCQAARAASQRREQPRQGQR